MKTMIWITVIVCCATIPVLSIAKPVEHHGMTVEADSPPKICLSCHDGSIAHIISYCTVMCDFSTSHSILKHYPPRGREREYASAAAVNARGIVLVDGQVVCISCHDLRQPGPNHLVMSNEKSRLCLSCHIKMDR